MLSLGYLMPLPPVSISVHCFFIQVTAVLPSVRTGNHDDGGNRDNHDYLQGLEAFFITVELADDLVSFVNMVVIS